MTEPTLFEGTATPDLLAQASAQYTPNYRQAPLVLVRGEGARVWDRDGKEYLDLVAGIAVCALGHAHPRLVEAVQDQAAKLTHVSSLFHNEPALGLLEALTSKSFGDQVFFANSGAEANEAAIKLARRYRAVVRGQPERSGVLCFEKSFHGRTYAAMTATGQPKYHAGFEPVVPGFHYARFADLDHVREVLDGADGTIGTVMVEPVQCEGGLNIPDWVFLRGLRELCDARDMLLIFDEVQTGVARTGKLWCYEHPGVAPDIMSLAKGLGGGVPLGAMVATAEAAQGFQPGSHASTFGGNPLATRAGLAVMQAIDEEGLLGRANALGDALHGHLTALAERHADRCVEARGLGLLRGLELRGDATYGKRVVEACRGRGVLTNAIGGKVLRFVPPLVITSAQLAHAAEVLDGVLAEVPPERAG